MAIRSWVSLALLGLAHGEQAILSPGITASSKLVDSEALQATISSKNLLARAEHLYRLAELSYHDYNRPTRVIGSAGHNATLEYIYATIAKLGDYYNISEQLFPAYTSHFYEGRILFDDVPLGNSTVMGLSPPTKNKEPVYGELVLVENSGCHASDFPDTVSGNIAFVKRGICPFGTKSALAGRAGAVAAVVFSNEPGLLMGTLGQPSEDHVATFSVSADNAAPYLKELQKGGQVEVTAYVDSDVNSFNTLNIVAQTAQGDPDNCVMLGAHSDSVDAGPGINDDGSGTLSLLEVATHLTKFSVNNCVRFAWWAAEEEGLLGSDFYANSLSPEENKRVRLFMDYDMMGSPNFAYQIYNATNKDSPVGSEELRDLYVDWYEAHGLNYTFIPFDGRSDYDGFIRNSIPAGGIATGAEVKKSKKEVEMFGGKAGDAYDPCYHSLCDDVGNVNLTAWEINTKLIAHSVATYARSFDGFPKREEADFAGQSIYEQATVYHGHKMFI